MFPVLSCSLFLVPYFGPLGLQLEQEPSVLAELSLERGFLLIYVLLGQVWPGFLPDGHLPMVEFALLLHVVPFLLEPLGQFLAGFVHRRLVVAEVVNDQQPDPFPGQGGTLTVKLTHRPRILGGTRLRLTPFLDQVQTVEDPLEFGRRVLVLSALRETRALPSGVLGPFDFLPLAWLAAI